MSIGVSSRGTERRRRARWEVGGEFDAREVPTGTTLPWPTPHRLYGLAQHALIAMWETLPAAPSRTLHVPDYFCPEVVVAWRRAGIRIREYLDDPRWLEPDWSSLAPDAGDAVLAVNFFGVRNDAGWTRWRRRHPDMLLVEDHSHDPRSRWARLSMADYAFASLRKTFPVSDGAILWSPGGAQLPGAPRASRGNGSDLKRAAMVLKHDYLAGGPVDKEAFRALQIRGERDLLASKPSAITPWSRRIVERGLPAIWRERRRRNVRTLIGLIAGAPALRLLFTTWPLGHCPYNLVLLFPTESSRDACRAHLISQGIYPPVHWAQPAQASRRAQDLASVILTVPADQRYGSSDIRRVAAALVSFDESRTTAATR
jgi:hypothetical protein